MVRTLLYIFDTNEDLLVILKPDGGCPYKEAPHTEQINKENYFQFWVPADHPDSEHVKQENLVAFKDEDGELRLFVIKELDEVHDDEIYREAFCQAAWIEELSDEPIEDRRLYDKTAAEALGVALENTRHSVGIVAELGINSTNFYYESVESAIRKIISTWGGEIRDRIEVTDDGEITERFIDILPRRGADTGKRFEISKDIQSLKRTVLSYPKTALYGRGSSLESGDGFGRKITFADVVWNKANGDPVDKPAGQEWVGDPGALSQFGRLNSDGSKRHRFGFFESTEEEDPVQLLQDTWLELQVRKKPVVQYELNVVDLEEASDHEKVRLGDTVFCIDRHFSPPVLVEARVIEVKRYRNEPHRTEVKIGNFLPANTDEQRIEEMERTVQVNREKWENPNIGDNNFPDIKPEAPANVTVKGLFKTILLKWLFEPVSHIAAYEVYGSQVQGFTPDSSNLLFRGKTGGIIHNAETDQQWYFRVRAVNTHGTPSAFSLEVSASTIRVGTVDYEELSIIDAYILNVSADKLTAGTIDAGEINVINLNADNIVAGQIKTSLAKIVGVDNLFYWDGNKLIAINQSDTNKFARLDSNGLYIAKGAMTIERPDGYKSVIDGVLRNSFTIQGSEPAFQTLAVEKFGQFYRTKSDNRYENMQRFSFKHDARYVRIICNMFCDAGEGSAYNNVGNMAFDVFDDGETISKGSAYVTENRHHDGQGYRKDLLIDLGTPTGELLVMYWRMWNNIANWYTYGSIRYIVQEG
jgi:phage minor structural protein